MAQSIILAEKLQRSFPKPFYLRISCQTNPLLVLYLMEHERVFAPTESKAGMYACKTF